MTQKAEQADDETTHNVQLSANDFPSDLYNYEAKAYKVEYLGEENMEGTDTYKIKMTKEPALIDGQEVATEVFYYFDKDSGALLFQEEEVKQGPGKGVISQITMSDYDEVNGLYFPFSISQGVKGQGSQPIIIEKIETDVDIDEDVFEFPEDTTEDEGDDN